MKLSDFYKGKVVLVTGHTGFKGSWLAKTLSLWGAKVYGVALKPHTTPNMYEVIDLAEDIKSNIADILDLNGLKKLFSEIKPQIVFHLAAQAIVKVSYDDPMRTYAVNILGSAHILEAVRNTPSVKSVVMITSDKAYKNKEWIYTYREIDELGGIDPYSASKAAADIVDQSFIASFFNSKGSPYCAISRAGNVIGGGDWSPNRIVPDVIRAVYVDKKPVLLRNPLAIRPWQHVLEPVYGYLLLGMRLYEKDKSALGEWNFGPNDENFVTVEKIVKAGLGIVNKGSFELEKGVKFHESHLLKLDICKSKAILDWHPVLSLNETLEYTYLWYKNFYEGKESPVEFTKKQINDFFDRIK